jgi:hypothetical protein
MAQQDTITHFSHPGHELVKRHYAGRWLCDMCWEDMSGPAYGCRAGCDFAIHESCARHPQTLSYPSPVHEHQLILIQSDRNISHRCDVCVGSCAAGCFLYRCPPCGFDVHPRCVQLPQVVRTTAHPEHDLTLVLADGRCAACNHGAGRAWYYRCMACNVDVHVSCAAGGGGEVPAAAAHHGNNQQRAQDLENELVRARMEGQINASSTAYTFCENIAYNMELLRRQHEQRQQELCWIASRIEF